MNLRRKVVVTGVGIISNLGQNITDHIKSLKSCESLLNSSTHLNSDLKNEFPFGEVSQSSFELAEMLNIPIKYRLPRALLLASKAIDEALKQSKIDVFNNRCDLIVGTTVGGIDISEDEMKKIINKEKIRFNTFLLHPCSFLTSYLANQYQFKGIHGTLSTACSSAANSILSGYERIAIGEIEMACVGGVDALCRFTVSGFNSLKILDKKHCKPFDFNRKGLNLGEGAGFLILENYDTAIKAKKNILAVLEGGQNSNDSYHQTASSEMGNGAFLSMSKAIKINCINPEQIDAINAHGTGTENNDLSETQAIQRLFGQNSPPFSSTKSYTGHTLGASGALESIFSIISLQEQVLFPTLRFEKRISNDLPTTFNEIIHKKVNIIMNNSFGFGGNCTSLVFSKYPSV